MAEHVFIVMSDPLADVPFDEFDAFYDLHVREILALPGWVAAERYSLRFIHSKSGVQPPFGHCVRYEIDGDFDAAWTALRAAVEAGQLTLPEWFSRLQTAGWQGTPLGGGRVLASDL